MDPIDLIRTGRIKRFFRATRKLNVPRLVFHITQRAAGKEPLFVEDSDYLFMLWLMKEISASHSLNIYAFCLMPNHAHFLMSTTEQNLYDAMRDLFSRYAMKFNKKYERKGHLFGGPYRQAVCLDDTYLLAASVYIHLNPVRAGLAADPLNYRWSSSRLYCGDRDRKSFVDPNFVLGILPGDGGRKRRYKLLLEKGMELETDLVLEKQDAIESLKSRLAAMFPSVFSLAAKAKRIAAQARIDILSTEELEGLVMEAKTAGRPANPESREAKRFLIEQLIARGYKRTEIAERLGMSRKTVYNLLKNRTQKGV
jgi:putative transposase